MLCARCFAMGFLLSKARLAGQFFLARLSGPRGPLHAGLELLRAEIAERRMQSALVVDLLDEAGKILNDIFERFVCHRIDRLDLHGFHEALHLGVVIRIAAPARSRRAGPLGRRPYPGSWEFGDRHLGGAHDALHSAAIPAAHGGPWPRGSREERARARRSWRRGGT